MKEIVEIDLERKKQGITKKELAELSGYTYYQIRRMFKGNISLKEKCQLRSVLKMK